MLSMTQYLTLVVFELLRFDMTTFTLGSGMFKNSSIDHVFSLFKTICSFKQNHDRNTHQRQSHHVTNSHDTFPVVRVTDANGQARNMNGSQNLSLNALHISTLVAPETSAPSGAFSGSGGATNYTSFKLQDSQLSLIQNVYLQFETNYNSTAT